MKAAEAVLELLGIYTPIVILFVYLFLLPSYFCQFARDWKNICDIWFSFYTQRINSEIQRLEEKEMTLEELELEDSNYTLIDRYKKKAIKVWDKLCEVQGRAASSGRPLERKFKCTCKSIQCYSVWKWCLCEQRRYCKLLVMPYWRSLSVMRNYLFSCKFHN